MHCAGRRHGSGHRPVRRPAGKHGGAVDAQPESRLAVHAGVVLACIAFGEMFAPMVVHDDRGRWGPMRSASTAYLAAGLVLLFIAGWTIVTDRTSEFLGILRLRRRLRGRPLRRYGALDRRRVRGGGRRAAPRGDVGLTSSFSASGSRWAPSCGANFGLIPPTILLALTGGAMLCSWRHDHPSESIGYPSAASRAARRSRLAPDRSATASLVLSLAEARAQARYGWIASGGILPEPARLEVFEGLDDLFLVPPRRTARTGSLVPATALPDEEHVHVG